MTKLLTKDLFIEIFKKEKYRKKLDKIILNFFGLETNKPEKGTEISSDEIILEILVFLNTEYLFKIIVKDKEKIFKISKKFYINFSYREVEKYYELLLPCYWEIYCQYAYHNLKNNPKIIPFASLFTCSSLEEIEKNLKKIHIFTNEEIREIKNSIEIKK